MTEYNHFRRKRTIERFRKLNVKYKYIKLKQYSLAICLGSVIPADTDVFKTSSGRLKKVTTSYDQTRRRHNVWKKTSNLRRLKDV